MEKMRRILFEELDYQIQGADIYNTKTSKWLIFTDSKKWVLEYTNLNTLWFNYTFFKNTLIFFGMDCADADSKNMIKEWFESRFLEKDIAHVTDTSNVPYSIVENTIQNGVKYVKDVLESLNPDFEDTLKNGVKTMMSGSEWYHKDEVEEIIQKGVKETIGTLRRTKLGVDDIIKNGVKEVKSVYLRSCLGVGDAIQNGVKHMMWSNDDDDVEDVIQNGVKEVKERLVESLEQKDHMVTNAIITEDINYAIENGVKE
jgi:hypothetical protein